MGLGEWSKRDSTGQSSKWVNQTAYLGVFVGKDLLQAMKDTWQKVTRKLKTAVNLWKARTLSLRGKALVINTCMVSRTVYTACVFPMPTETLTEVNKVIWPFLWNNSPDLVPREQATRPLSEDGLDIVDIPDKVRSIEIRAIEIFRAAAVEYDRLKEKPCWSVLAEQRLEAESILLKSSRMAGQGQDGNSKTGPRPIRKVFRNTRPRHWSLQPAIRANLKTDNQKNGQLGPCTYSCVGRKTVGSLQKEWQQNGSLGKNNSKKLGKPPGNQFKPTTSSKGLNGDSWTRYSQPATDYHESACHQQERCQR